MLYVIFQKDSETTKEVMANEIFMSGSLKRMSVFLSALFWLQFLGPFLLTVIPTWISYNTHHNGTELFIYSQTSTGPASIMGK